MVKFNVVIDESTKYYICFLSHNLACVVVFSDDIAIVQLILLWDVNIISIPLKLNRGYSVH